MMESTCGKCGNVFVQTGKDSSGKKFIKKFCSRKCANSRCWTDDDKKRISESLKTSDVAKAKNAKKRLESFESGLRLVKECKHCGEPFEVWASSRRAIFCSTKCCKDYKKSKYGSCRLKIDDVGSESKGSLKAKTINWQQWRCVITDHAQKKMSEKDDAYSCRVCGYTTYNEICHLKSVADFDDSITLDVINNIDNLVYMCRNHHWEFDHGIITIEDLLNFFA